MTLSAISRGQWVKTHKQKSELSTDPTNNSKRVPSDHFDRQIGPIDWGPLDLGQCVLGRLMGGMSGLREYLAISQLSTLLIFKFHAFISCFN